MSRIVLLLVIILLIINISVFAAGDFKVYINEQDTTSRLKPVKKNNTIMVRARALAEEIDAEIKWSQSVETLYFEKNNTVIKMMVGNDYIQVNNKTDRSKTPLELIEGKCYVSPREIVTHFGYLFSREDSSIYISKPESLIEAVNWQKEGQQLEIEMNKISPYRINKTEDPERLELELERAELAEDFVDDLSNDNFYLRIERLASARLKLILISKYPIPFQGDQNIEEKGSNLVINFLPYITSVKWKEQQLEITANGEMKEPQVLLLQNPRRLVMDIPDLMLNDFDMELPENEWIKDVRVSQFKDDPVTLRLVVELYKNRYLNLVRDEKKDKYILAPTKLTNLKDLSVTENRIRFTTDQSIRPDTFNLEDPDRMVINIVNAVRGEGIPDKLEANGKIIKSVRSSRFDEETVRLVVDLATAADFTWQEEEKDNGEYIQQISLKGNYRNIVLNDSDEKTDININFMNKVDYEVEKFTYPDRLVVDVHGLERQNIQELPEPTGVIKDIKVTGYKQDAEVTRIVFETSEYYQHKVYSLNPDNTINISLIKEEEIADDKKEDDIIIIDAGHGGFDPGAVGPSGLQEKDVNLDIAFKVNKLLKNKDYRVELTRDKDVFISLKERVAIANDLNARIFVSIHANSSNSGYSEGTETYIAPDKVTESKLLADLLQEKLLSELSRVDRGTKQENFYVVKHTEMPAALVEIAFLSNSHEETLLENDLFKERAARAITEGIIEYIEKTERGDEEVDE